MSAPLLSCYVTCRKLLRIICCFCNFFPPPFLFTVDDALQLISSLFSCNSEILFIHSYANNTEIKHFFPFIFSILIIFYPPNFLHFSIHLLYSHWKHFFQKSWSIYHQQNLRIIIVTQISHRIFGWSRLNNYTFKLV